MPKAISTKYLPATNFRGSRIKAYAEGGNSITIDCPRDANPGEDAARVAAEALRDKMGWTGELIGGGTEEGWVFVFLTGTYHGKPLPPLNDTESDWEN